MDAKMLAEYFNRIGLPETWDVSEESMKRIHRFQHRSIPFENLDVIDGKPILLSDEALYQKLIIAKRGGYCQELNGLLYNVLKYIGFEARPLLGRVHLRGEPTGRGHRVTLVTINDKQWIVDAGFGSYTPREPLPIELNKALKTDLQTYRFIRHERFGLVLQIQESGQWQSIYSLDMTYVFENDLEYSNHFTSTHSSSAFTANCIAAFPTNDGIITLLNQTLKVKKGDAVEEIILADETAYFQALETYFGLVPKVSYQSLQACFT